MLLALRLACVPLTCIPRCAVAPRPNHPNHPNHPTQPLAGRPLAGRLWHGHLWHVAAVATACINAAFVTSDAAAQGIVYQSFSPVVTYATPMAAGYPGGYMANYSPAGNYAAVTAFSPPVAMGYVAGYPVTQVANYPVTQVANYPVTQVANYAVESSMSVTSFYAPAPMAAPVMAAPVAIAPVTTYYAPAAVAVPLYRRGPFGGLRPARSAMYIPY